jgi:hypothetical protein
MLGRESVKARLASEHGISYTEFSYMLIQANDFLHLEQAYGCQLQVGGSDQLGNMIGGIDLIRRVAHRPAWALAWPLLTAPDGTKLGKTTGARIWLDPAKTSPYQFFQHWMGTDDRQVRQFLLQFTLLPVGRSRSWLLSTRQDPGPAPGPAASGRGGHRDGARVPMRPRRLQTPARSCSGAPVTSASRRGWLRSPSRSASPPSPGASSMRASTWWRPLVRHPALAASKGEARRALSPGGRVRER